MPQKGPVTLIRRVDLPDGRGPGNGQFALQRALVRNAPPWFSIADPDRIPPGGLLWFWCWEDTRSAATVDAVGRPTVLGPNIFFHNSRRPGSYRGERLIMGARNCRLLFTESRWYAQLLRDELPEPLKNAPLELFPYPIDPIPGPPWPPGFDLLIYDKSGAPPAVAAELARRFPNSHTIAYGHYNRADLIATARRSKACVYLSRQDRGPLALAEILLSGCPAVGTDHGAPWLADPALGEMLATLQDVDPIVESVARLQAKDRAAVRRAALAFFDADQTARHIFAALERVR